MIEKRKKKHSPFNFLKKGYKTLNDPLVVVNSILKTTLTSRKKKDQSLGSYLGDVVVKGINKSGKEVHFPGGYRFLGPGTHLKKRLTRGDRGINDLDEAAREHDIAYDQYMGLGEGKKHLPEKVKEADKILNHKATSIYKDSSKPIKERIAAFITSKTMGVKS